jgi:beta-lactamase class A
MTHLTRRTLLLAGPALALPSLGVAASSATPFAAIEKASGGKMGVCVIDTATGATLTWRADARFPFCSSFKAPLAAFVLWKTDHGQLRLDQPIRYGAADLLSYAPIARAHVARGRMSVEELCAAAVSYSDNTAANLLLRETGGPAALTAWMRARGDRAFDLASNEPGLNLSRYGDAADTTTARAMAESYRRFVLGNVLTPASRGKLAAWLVANTTGDRRLRAGLPRAWRVGDKTGTFGGEWFSTIDIAVAWPPARPPLVIAGLVTGPNDTASAERALVQVAREAAIWAGRQRRAGA